MAAAQTTRHVFAVINRFENNQTNGEVKKPQSSMNLLTNQYYYNKLSLFADSFAEVTKQITETKIAVNVAETLLWNVFGFIWAFCVVSYLHLRGER